MFGAHNITKWADLDSQVTDPDNIDQALGEKLDAVVTDVIERKSAYVNSRLRRGPYEVPFSAPYPEEIIEATTQLAGSELYMPFRLTDDSDQVNQTVAHEKAAEKTLDKILANVLHIDASKRVTTAPAAVDIT